MMHLLLKFFNFFILLYFHVQVQDHQFQPAQIPCFTLLKIDIHSESPPHRQFILILFFLQTIN